MKSCAPPIGPAAQRDIKSYRFHLMIVDDEGKSRGLFGRIAGHHPRGLPPARLLDRACPGAGTTGVLVGTDAGALGRAGGAAAAADDPEYVARADPVILRGEAERAAAGWWPVRLHIGAQLDRVLGGAIGADRKLADAMEKNEVLGGLG